jgi:hypothetical protein
MTHTAAIVEEWFVRTRPGFEGASPITQTDEESEAYVERRS